MSHTMFNRLYGVAAIITSVVLLGEGTVRCSEVNGPMQQQLQSYIHDGLTASLTLQQERADLGSADASVNEARARFLPTLNFSSRYTHSEGGRSVNIPVGDWMSQMFPSPNPFFDQDRIAALNATSVTIVPERDQETKLQLTQPIFAPEIVLNYRMNVSLLKAKAAAFEAAQLALIHEIRGAYYTCLQAREAVELRSAACKRTARQLFTAQKLVESGMLTRTGFLAADAAHAASVSDSLQSRYDLTDACRHFNTIVNKPSDSPVIMVPPDSFELTIAMDDSMAVSDSGAVEARRELAQLRFTEDALLAYEQMEKSAFAPKLAAVVEGGIVGERFEFSDQTRFYTASLLLQWELFSGFGKKNRLRKATFARESMHAKTASTRAMMTLQKTRAENSRLVAVRRCHDSEKQWLYADKNYTEAVKLFEQGAASAQQLIDAQTLLASADAARSVARYELFRKWADVQAAIAADTALCVMVKGK